MEKQEKQEINKSERTHELKAIDCELSDQEIKELFDWFDGKIIRSEEY